MAKDKRASVYFDRETLMFAGLDTAMLLKLKEAYKHLDVSSELEKMSFWLSSPKGSQRKGNINFILNWLSSASPSKSKAIPLDVGTSPLDPYLSEYRKDLWKGREHILSFNKMST